MLHKVKRWVSCPTLFYGWVGIGAYARRALKGGTYHPVCIRLAFGMCIPRTLWVGKVGLKDGLKWPSSATGPSLLGSMGLRAGQVKTWMIYQVGLSVLHRSAKSTPTTCPPNKTPTPTTTMVKSSLLRLMTKQSTPWHHHPLWHHLLAPVQHQSLPTAPPLRAPRAVLLAPALLLAPTSPACPPPPSGRLWVGHPTPVPCWTPDLAQPEALLFLVHHPPWHW